MNITIYFCAIVLFLILAGVIAILILNGKIKDLKVINKELEKENESKSDNVQALYQHNVNTIEIEKDKAEVDKKITEEESDEEVVDIVNSILAVNNNRVRNNKEGKN